ncbi:Protein kinase domain - like 10 [Theobroma cacao]|nr:Protein kinase domain - like 10 [Theobroma cacao]
MEISCFHSLVLLVHFFILCVARLHSLTTDQTALLALKAHINPETLNILANNWTAATSVCNWIGITCGGHPQRVIALNLSSMGLSGTIPPYIGNLSSLALLSIKNNSFYGSLPDEVAHLRSLKTVDFGINFLTGEIPPWFWSLPELENLVLKGNHFLGTVPSSLSNTTTLKNIDLSYNQLSGSISSNLFNVSSLQIIDLSFNRLSGRLSVDMVLPELQELYLSGNQLYGQISRSLFKCRQLEVLFLCSNNFTGAIPMELGNLTMLKELHLSHNNLEGTIPWEIGHLTIVKNLSISNNHLAGHIPSSIGNCTSLKEINFSVNNLTGISYFSSSALLACVLRSGIKRTMGIKYGQGERGIWHLRRMVLSGNPLGTILPRSIGNLSVFLEYFLVTDCKLKGSIPAEVGNLSSLIALKLGENVLTGIIPNSIGRLQKLQGLHLQSNRLQGTILHDVCNLSSLMELFLGGNELSGLVPECLGNLTALRNISLGSNRLTSMIPSSLWSLKDILAINMSSNCLQGSLPLEIKNLKVVTEIDLAKNQLSGYIPNSIGELKNLVYLSLAENNLQGSIPESFGGSISLEFLDLSRNNLSGVIPKSLAKLFYLKYFSVSSNELQGEIPSGGPFANFTAQSYAMNKALCGAARLQVPQCKTGTSKGMWRRTIYLLVKIFVPMIASIYMLLLIRASVKHFQKRLISPFSTKKRTISYLEIALATDGFSESNLLGTGGFGSVYKGTMKEEKNVAIKIFNVHLERALRSFQVESKLLSINCHPNIVKLMNSFCDDDFKALVLEYMPNGTLDKWLHTHNYFLNLLQRLDIMIEVASALSYLHGKHVVHCDLKPSNVLLDEGMVAHVSDFSIAKLLGRVNVVQTETMATVGYMAPELSVKRKTMTEVELELEMIKQKFLRDTEWLDQREIYKSISRQELRLATNGFDSLTIVQVMESSVMHRGILPNGVIVATKVFNRLKSGRESFAVESEVLSFIRHRNVVQIWMMCNDADFKALVLQYMPNGSLERWLHHSYNIYFKNVLTMLNTMIDVASALCYLHLMRVIHCNLKPSTVLLDDDMVAHVSDFSIAKRLGERIAATKTRTMATVGYMAPDYSQICARISIVAIKCSKAITRDPIPPTTKPLDVGITVEGLLLLEEGCRKVAPGCASGAPAVVDA